MKRQKKQARKTGAIRAKTGRSGYARTLRDAPRDADITADIDAAVRQGEAIRAEIERRIEARLMADQR
jgi:hypothetical protein